MTIRLAFAAAAMAAAGCRGIYSAPHESSPDAAHSQPDAAAAGDAADAASQPDYGGELRLEWIENTAGQTTTRATAFFIQSDTPSANKIAFPGCADMRDDATWPIGQAPGVDLDVGTVSVRPPGVSPLALDRDSSGDEDFLGRPHTLWWKKLPTFAADDGSSFPDDQSYDVALKGSLDWPPQDYTTMVYMPVAFTVSPSPTTNIVLAPGDFSSSFTFGTAANRPAGVQQYLQVTFTSPNFVDAAGIQRPIVTCIFDAEPQAITIPAEIIELLRGYSTGDFYRQLVAEQYTAFTDDTQPAKSLDVIGEYEFDTTWSAN